MSIDKISVSQEELRAGAALAHNLMIKAEKLSSKPDLSFALAKDNSQEPKNVITQLKERGRVLLHEEFSQLIEQAQTAFAFALVGENIAPQEQLKQLVEHLSALIIEILGTWLFLSETNALVMIQELQQLGATKPLGIELAKETTAEPGANTPVTTPVEQPELEQEIKPEVLAKIEALNFRSKTGEDSISKQIVLCLARYFGTEIRSGFISSQTGLKATKVQQEMVKKYGIIRQLLAETGANGLRIKKVKENDRSCLYTLELVTDQQPSPGQPVTEESAQTDTEESDAEQTV